MAISDNLLSYWKFDESSGDATDSSGNGKTLTNGNSTAYAAAKINNGADFENSSSNKFTRSNDVYDVTSGTINCWIKVEAFSAAHMIISTATNVTTGGFYLGVRTTTPTEGVTFGFGAGNQEVASTNNALSAGTFYMVTATWSTLRKELFVNGSSNAANETDETLTAGRATLGVGFLEVLDASYFDGFIDEMGILSRVLTGDEITELYNSGTGLSYPFTSTGLVPRRALLGVGI